MVQLQSIVVQLRNIAVDRTHHGQPREACGQRPLSVASIQNQTSALRPPDHARMRATVRDPALLFFVEGTLLPGG